ncbi:hypothetical protein BH24ACT1_BH24ACT1_08960 [soil metagenome]
MSGRRVVAGLVLLVVVLALVNPSATGQEPTAVPDTSATTDGPDGNELDGGLGSPEIFVVLSVLGGSTAAAMLGVQWVRTRPRGHRSD